MPLLPKKDKDWFRKDKDDWFKKSRKDKED